MNCDSQAWILTCEPNREIDDHLANSRTARLSLVRRIPLLGDQLAMPAEDRVRREQRADFKEPLAAEYLAFDGQSPALAVVEQNAFLPELLFQYSILSSQVIDRFLLLSIDPRGE